jgi:Ca2+-binding RTX toxin-like protein
MPTIYPLANNLSVATDLKDYSGSLNTVLVNLATGQTGGRGIIKIVGSTTSADFTATLTDLASTLSATTTARFNINPTEAGAVLFSNEILVNVKNLIGSDHNDHLIGDDRDNVINPGLSRAVRSGYSTTVGTVVTRFAETSSDPSAIGFTSFDVVDGGAGNDLLIVDYSIGDDVGSVNGSSSDGGAGEFTRYGAKVGDPNVDTVRFSNIERLQVTGSSKNDTLFGGSGDDTLNGGAGNDILVGGPNTTNSSIIGNDVINGGDGDDEIANRNYNYTGSDVNLLDKFDGGAGFDTLSANFSNQTADVNFIGGQSNDITFADGTFAKNFEDIRYIETGSGNDTLILTGRVSNYSGFGSIRRQIKTGAGNDTINPGVGDVEVDAGLGNDLLILDYSLDEPIGGGGVTGNITTGFPATGTTSFAAYTRNGANNTFLDRLSAANIERYQITGTSKDDKLTGWEQDDIFTGLGGNDTLTGGGGSDRFVFSSGSAVGNTVTIANLGIDTITDFQVGIDSIVLDPQIFGTNRSFESVTTDGAAALSSASIVYNSANGNLFYNPNGFDAGFGTGGQFAILSNKVALTGNDIKTRGMRSSDFNGDGKSDILWRNDYGSVALWQMNGATVTSGSLTSVPDLDLSWKVAGIGDFNGDGKSDILWRNTSGAIAVWAMDGATVKSSTKTSTPSLDNSWKTAGTGDYNGDGKSDILWRNDDGTVVVWTMDGTTVTSSSKTATPVLDNSWKVAGNSDFDGDGKSDILWRNDDGSVALWQMNGNAIKASNAVSKVATDWKIAGTGDFNSDSKADILWRNDDGRVVLWQMNGAAITSSSLTSTPSRDSSQTVAGISDYNGDGKADILWRKDTGALEVWQMNSSTVVSSTPTSVAADGGFWKIAAPII